MKTNARPQPGTDALRAISQLMEDASDQQAIQKELVKTGFNLEQLKKNIASAITEATGRIELAAAKSKRTSLLGRAHELLANLPKARDPRRMIGEYLDEAFATRPQFAVQFRGKLESTSDAELESLLEDMAVAAMMEDESDSRE
jgi:hypothetical protein